MKKTFIYSIFAFALLALPAESLAQSKPLFPFGREEKQVSEVAETAAPSSAAAEQTLEDIKNEPVSVRRKMVASELRDILLRLNVIYDKTKVASDRLGQNGIPVEASNIQLASAAAALTSATHTIDAISLAASDPLNESVEELVIDGAPFKTFVIKAEGELRSARESIINSLQALKAAVAPSPAPSAH